MRRFKVLLLCLLLLGGVSSVLARSDASSILRRTASVSGVSATSSGYRSSGAIGQGIVGSATSERFQATAGFYFPNQHGTGVDELWLPLLSR